MAQDYELSSSEEEYLEAIYTRQEGKAQVATTRELATCLGVRDASVTEMLKKLSEKGLVNYTPYHGATLTKTGCEIATKVKRKHRLLERFWWIFAGSANASRISRRVRSNTSFRMRLLTTSQPSWDTRQRVLGEARYPPAVQRTRPQFQSFPRLKKGRT